MSNLIEILNELQAASDASLAELTGPQIPLFKCRASAAGKIMTEPKGMSIKQRLHALHADIFEKAEMQHQAKNKGTKTYLERAEKIERMKSQAAELEKIKDVPNLSATCIAHLKEWLIEQLYGGRKEFTAKPTEKGTKVEEDAIIYASCHIADMGLCSKNLEQFWNDWFTGEPDVLIRDFVPDIKSSYTQFTFPLMETDLPESDYDYQVTVYADLLKKTRGRVIYVLMSMPEEMIIKEARWKLPQDYTPEQYEAFAAQYRYDHLPPYLRLKEFEVEITQDKINAIRQRVEDCRAYIANVLLPEVEKNRLKYQD